MAARSTVEQPTFDLAFALTKVKLPTGFRQSEEDGKAIITALLERLKLVFSSLPTAPKTATLGGQLQLRRAAHQRQTQPPLHLSLNFNTTHLTNVNSPRVHAGVKGQQQLIFPSRVRRWPVLFLMLSLLCRPAAAEEISQFKGQVNSAAATRALPKGPPAKELFGAVSTPAPLASRAIGSYVKGCLSGGVSLPVTGPDWQVMRTSRNRNWGHPRLLAYLERLASDARALDGWPGLLVGDMAQPRGGPMLSGHSSHQIGLDADIWLTAMPNRVLSSTEREEISAVSMLKDPFTVDMRLWSPLHTRLIKRAASYSEVARIFVHPAIKQVLCDQAGGDRAWLAKVRPWWGHYYHFHVRIACPRASVGCEGQNPVTGDDGCGAELDTWFKRLQQAEMQPPRPGKPAPATAPLGLDALPKECRTVLTFGHNPASSAAAARMRAAADRSAGPPPPHLGPASGDSGFRPPRPVRSIWGN